MRSGLRAVPRIVFSAWRFGVVLGGALVFDCI